MPDVVLFLLCVFCFWANEIRNQTKKLFAASGLEDESFGTELDLSNSMGLFLQKTNITRDYYEDLQENRVFWPKATW